MATSWRNLFAGSNGRRRTILIIFSALVPFTFCFIWLLSLSHPAQPTLEHPLESDHHHDEPDHHYDIHYDDETSPSAQKLTVKAPTGSYIGKINEKYENVHEFLNVPYGLSTAGKNRFMPPVPVPKSDETFDATKMAMACPQYVSSSRSIWSEQVPWYRIPHGDIESPGQTLDSTSEDCLSMAIWAPANATENSDLPVAMFWPGGGFSYNGILVPAHQAAPWVSRSQSHIVVTINYRLSIMGFPMAAGVEEQNLGLLDQRAALEWVRDNIRHFGGDPSKILVWGFSAGAQSVDFHNYAYWEDPIAHAHFAQSGSCLAFGSGQDNDPSKFTFVAKNVGCNYPNDSTKELECMQQVEYKDIINFIGRHSGTPRLRFRPVTDGKTVFEDYRRRYAAGKVTKAPMIYSSCSNDGSSLSRYSADNPERGPDQESVNGVTKQIMCGAADSSMLRYDMDLTTYRYQYAGSWPNQNPLDWMGAYHSSDLVMFFGTHDDFDGPSSTRLEIETSEVMQDYLLAFMRDPHDGPASMGWPAFDPTADDGGKILRFGAGGKAAQNASANSVEGACLGHGPYEPFP